MSRNLIGGKLRTLRKARGLSQAALAAQLGISPSYLNLIEADRRSIGGALLQRVAQALGVSLDDVDGAAERRLVERLADLGHEPLLAGLALDAATAAELVSRHRPWADALVELRRALADRDAAVGALSDRLAHDPFLGDAVHTMLTQISAVRSAAEILEGGSLDEATRARFTAIAAGDSRRLSEVGRSLAAFFTRARAHRSPLTPTDEVDDFLARHDNHFPSLEQAVAGLRFSEHGQGSDRAPSSHRFAQALAQVEPVVTGAIETLLADHVAPLSAAAQARLREALTAYAAAALLMPYDTMLASAREWRYDVDRLARRFGTSFEQTAHRLATLRRPGAEGLRFGFLRADPAGHVSKRLPLPGLPLPRYGLGCPLWAVYAAYRQPGALVAQQAEHPGGERTLMVARASETAGTSFDAPSRWTSVMLITDALHADLTVYGRAGPVIPVGPGCRSCARLDCASRQEDPVIDGLPRVGSRAAAG